MTRTLIVFAAFLGLAAPAALAVPPADQGRRQAERLRQARLDAREGAEVVLI